MPHRRTCVTDLVIHVNQLVVQIPYNALQQMEVFTASGLDKVNNAVLMEKEMPAIKDITARTTLMEHGAALTA